MMRVYRMVICVMRQMIGEYPSFNTVTDALARYVYHDGEPVNVGSNMAEAGDSEVRR